MMFHFLKMCVIPNWQEWPVWDERTSCHWQWGWPEDGRSSESVTPPSMGSESDSGMSNPFPAHSFIANSTTLNYHQKDQSRKLLKRFTLPKKLSLTNINPEKKFSTQTQDGNIIITCITGLLSFPFVTASSFLLSNWNSPNWMHQSFGFFLSILNLKCYHY